MSTDHLERVAEAARRASTTNTSNLTAELQHAVLSASDDGASLTAIAAAANIPTLAVLDAIDARTNRP